MPPKSHKNGKKGKRDKKTRKQKLYVMRGCSENSRSNMKKNNKNKKNKSMTLEKKSCRNCGPNCNCGPKCNCVPNCPGNCGPKKGGSGCGSCGCPIAPLSWKEMNQFGGASSYGPILGVGQNGGVCGVGSGKLVGGNASVLKPLPGPFIGSAWSAPASKWPGVNDIGGDRNYLKNYDTTGNNIISKDPQLQMSMNDAGYNNMMSKIGGKKSKKGGGILPQDLVNLGQDFSYNFKSAYNTLNGYSAPVNPLPYKDQLTGSINKKILI